MFSAIFWHANDYDVKSIVNYNQFSTALTSVTTRNTNIDDISNNSDDADNKVLKKILKHKCAHLALWKAI